MAYHILDQRLEDGTVFDDIHSDVLPKYVYKRMRPAFELASAMFTHSEAYNIRTLCASILAKDGLLVLDADYDITPADRKQYRKFLLKLKDDISLHFGSSRVLQNEHAAFGTTVLLNSGPYTPDLLVCEINKPDLDFYSDPNFDSYSEKHRMKVHFNLAITLSHEAAHFFHVYRISGPDQYKLTYHLDHKEPEIGVSWTHYFFNDPPQIANLVDDHRGALARTDDSDNLSIDLSDTIVINAHGWNPRVKWNIHSDIIEAFFDLDLWEGMLTQELKECMARTGGSLDLLKTVGMSVFGDGGRLKATKCQMVLRNQM